jgi:hypothetical protein
MDGRIRMDLGEMEEGFVNWMHVAGSCEPSNETSGSIKSAEFLD